jgi:CheY-like chemotaxis protein
MSNNNDNNVFVIEDDKIASSIIKSILNSNKSIKKFDFFTNGLEALEILKIRNTVNEKLPDFIILDFDMPIMNGLEFLKCIKHLDNINQIPIFMNSASNELLEYHNCLHYENVKGNFSKPFSEHILKAILGYVENS